MTNATGTALISFAGQTFVMIEVDQEPLRTPAGIYQAVEADEIAALYDAMDDDDNPDYRTTEALQYFQARRSQRGDHGRR